MSWWLLEALQTAGVLAVAVVIREVTRRPARAYAETAFEATPAAGAAFVRLADATYYVIALAYALLTFEVQGGIEIDGFDFQDGDVDRLDVRDALSVMGGMALISGLLHGVYILAIPAMGRLLARRAG